MSPVNDPKGHDRKCPRCKGTGKVPEPFEPIRCDPPGTIICPLCKGKGYIDPDVD